MSRPAVLRPPVVLSGRYLRLTPMQAEDADALAAAGADPEIWRFFRAGNLAEPARMRTAIAELLQRQARGTDLLFTIRRQSDGRPVGATRFLEIDRSHDSAEIGGSWLSRPLWRSPFNTEAKRLLLGHAFDSAGLHRVFLKTDLRNTRSQRAIERLGAVREGVWREHLVLPDGWRRSSVYYSILAPEWPAVRARLDALLARPWPTAPLAPTDPRGSP